MITAVVLAKNEEKNIVDCLESLSFCSEIIVIDDNSVDRTAEIAKNSGVKVIKRSLDGNFSEQRNFALSQSRNDWTLFVDADERISKDLGQEIKRSTGDYSVDGYFIPREDKLFGKILKHGELRNKKFLRLARTNAGKWRGTVHEEWNIKGKTKTLKHPMLHLPHQTISEFLREINYYTTLRAIELHEKGERTSWYKIIFYTKAKFIQTYILKFGFLDGMSGFVLSMVMSFHSFLVRGKLYMLQNKKVK